MKTQTARLALALSIAVAAFLLLTALLTPSATKTLAAPDAPRASTAPITITLWHPHAPPREGVMEALINEYSDTNGLGITVIGSYVGRYADIRREVIAGLRGDGPVPNLAVAYPNDVAEFARYGAVHFIDDYLAAVDTSDVFTDVLTYYRLPEYGYQTAGLQHARSLEAMFYNTHLLTTTGTAVPTTWAEFRTACQDIAAGAGVAGTIPGTDASRFATWLWTRGGELISEDANHARFAEQPGIEAVRVFRDLMNLEVAYYSSDVLGPFANGEVAFIQGSSSAIPYIASMMDNGAGHAWGVTRVPALPGHEAVNSYGGGVTILHESEAADAAAWEFLWWLVQREQTARWAAYTGYFPVAISAATHPSITQKLASNAHYAQAYALQDLGRTEPGIRSWPPIRGLLSAAMRDIFEYGADITDTLESTAAYADSLLWSEGPESAEIPPTGGTLSSDSGTYSTTVSFPAGAVSISSTFSLVPVDDLPTAGPSFALVPAATFTTPVTITITYTDTALAGMDEDLLKLWVFDWESNSWVNAAPCGGHVHLPELNTFSAGVCHFSDYALLDYGRFIYLPLVIRN